MTSHCVRQPGPRQQRGFSLVEMMVALVIMAVLSILAYSAFDGVLQMETRSKEQFLGENRLQLASAVILNDLIHLRQRPVRDILGGQEAAYLAPQGEFVVVFSRGGSANASATGGSVQRLGYRVEDGNLIRSRWQVVDQGPATLRQDQVLATGIDSLTVEQLDKNGDFTAFWPPANEPGHRAAVPALMRVTLAAVDSEPLTLLVPGPDAGVASTLPGGAGDGD